MNYFTNYDQIVKLVLDGVITSTLLSNDILGTQFGFKIVEIKRDRFDRRNSFVDKENQWHFGDEELSWGVNLGIGYASHQIDITTNGKYLCYRHTFVEHIFYEIQLLAEQEIQSLKEKLQLEKIEKEIRQEIVDKLTRILINQMYPYSKLFTGELETKYGIHLKEIQRAEHRFMKYVPNTSNQQWVINGVLCWGSNTGWDVMRDGKIACCRINYDDYISFEIEALSENEINEYKKKFGSEDKIMINRLATIHEMFEKGLLSSDEYTIKKNEIIASI